MFPRLIHNFQDFSTPPVPAVRPDSPQVHRNDGRTIRPAFVRPPVRPAAATRATSRKMRLAAAVSSPFRRHLSLLTRSCVSIHRCHPCCHPCRHRHHRHHLAIVATTSMFSSSLSPLLAQSCAPTLCRYHCYHCYHRYHRFRRFRRLLAHPYAHTPPSSVNCPSPPFCCSSESDCYRQSRLFVRRPWKSYRQNINAD